MLSVNLAWIVLALMAGIFSAVIILINQYYKIPGILLVIISRFFTLTMLIPLMFWVKIPTEPIYYIAVAITGMIAGFGDIRTFNVVAKLGGGVVSRLTPLLVPITFVAWFLVQPSDLIPYFSTPLKTIGIIAMIISCSFFASKMTNCQISKEGFKLMLPVIIGYSVNAVLAKIAMNNADLIGGVYMYMVIQSIFALLFTYIYYWGQKKNNSDNFISLKLNFSRKLIIVSFIASIFWIAHITSKIAAFTFIDNPAYPNALVLLTPVWVLIFYKITKHKENANITAGIGVMISAIILVILTAN